MYGIQNGSNTIWLQLNAIIIIQIYKAHTIIKKNIIQDFRPPEESIKTFSEIHVNEDKNCESTF